MGDLGGRCHVSDQANRIIFGADSERVPIGRPEETLANIKEAIELYLETPPTEERDGLLSREILTTAVEVDA
jgi:hypothetical protein